MHLGAPTETIGRRPERTRPRTVGPGFVGRYAAVYLGTSLVLIAPVSITLTLKINALVGIRRAPGALALVVGIGSLVALIGNPLVGRLSDRTTSRFGMRRPWMVVGVLGGTGAIFGGVRFGRRASPHNQHYADGDLERQPTASRRWVSTSPAAGSGRQAQASLPTFWLRSVSESFSSLVSSAAFMAEKPASVLLKSVLVNGVRAPVKVSA
jgi:hypothetical protein